MISLNFKLIEKMNSINNKTKPSRSGKFILKSEEWMTKIKVLVVAMSGKLGSGKDYLRSTVVAPYINEIMSKTDNNEHKSIKRVESRTFAFGDTLKEICMIQYGLSYESVYEKKTSASRKALQTIATNLKEAQGPDVWIYALHNKIKRTANRLIDEKFRGALVVFITDLRFRNELSYINKMNGLVIRINAPTRNAQKLQQECRVSKDKVDMDKLIALGNHTSEIDLDDINFEYVIDNDPQHTKTVAPACRVLIDKYIDNKLLAQSSSFDSQEYSMELDMEY